MKTFTLTAKNQENFEKLSKRYPRIDSMMLPTLWLVQEQEGWISPEAMIAVANMLSTTPMRVYEVVTFYSMYNTKPIGTHHIEVCKTTSCMLCGSKEIISYLEETLDIKPGETSKDGQFTLSAVECLGSC
ncbi:MAG: NADH-quinone oxidoreductase subunit E, partial [Sulfurimonas sp.]|uniref:NADH-quinone oxidoreductase subunit NuoE family protein n=1 Tax=Sulfurimonas sp. TaxID=2022749 RepID=UPI0039E55CCE